MLTDSPRCGSYGRRFTAATRCYPAKGYDLDVIEHEDAERFMKPLRMPVAAIYSKRLGILAWQACIDRCSPDTRHIEVSETHFGMRVR